MKKIKKAIIGMMVTIMAATILVSCGEPKVPPEESTRIFLDMLLKEDKLNIGKINITEDDYVQLKKEKDKAFMEGFNSGGMDEKIFTDEFKTTLRDKFYAGFNHITYEVTPVSKQKDTAQVSVKIKVLDMDKIMKDGEAKVMEEALADPSMTEDEIYKELIKYLGDAIAAGTVKDQPQTVMITLTKQSNMWMINDNDVDRIMSAVMDD